MFFKKRGQLKTVTGYKGNAMTPLNWFSGISEALLLSGILGAQESWLKISCLILFVGIIGIYSRAYFYFMKKDPDRLQTEAYNLESRQMTLLDTPQSVPPELRADTQSSQVYEIGSPTPIVQGKHLPNVCGGDGQPT